MSQPTNVPADRTQMCNTARRDCGRIMMLRDCGRYMCCNSIVHFAGLIKNIQYMEELCL